jgi:hypothetical protein
VIAVVDAMVDRSISCGIACLAFGPHTKSARQTRDLQKAEIACPPITSMMLPASSCGSSFVCVRPAALTDFATVLDTKRPTLVVPLLGRDKPVERAVAPVAGLVDAANVEGTETGRDFVVARAPR